jgi:hypothetical protein
MVVLFYSAGDPGKEFRHERERPRRKTQLRRGKQTGRRREPFGEVRAVDIRPRIVFGLVRKLRIAGERILVEEEITVGTDTLRSIAGGPFGARSARERKMEKPTERPAADSNAPAGPVLTPAETETYVEQIEEFEGPNRREKRGSESETPKEPGVARS